jgi:hypothetical protein
MAALIRDAIERTYPGTASEDTAWERALDSIGGFSSGRRDISTLHDDHLADAFAE